MSPPRSLTRAHFSTAASASGLRIDGGGRMGYWTASEPDQPVTPWSVTTYPEGCFRRGYRDSFPEAASLAIAVDSIKFFRLQKFGPEHSLNSTKVDIFRGLSKSVWLWILQLSVSNNKGLKLSIVSVYDAPISDNIFWKTSSTTTFAGNSSSMPAGVPLRRLKSTDRLLLLRLEIGVLHCMSFSGLLTRAQKTPLRGAWPRKKGYLNAIGQWECKIN